MSELRDELYSLLVPLAGERLIVPRACVAEVIGYQAPAEMTNAPPWYVGVVSWSGRSVPVVSFEGAFGQTLPTSRAAPASWFFTPPAAKCSAAISAC